MITKYKAHIDIKSDRSTIPVTYNGNVIGGAIVGEDGVTLCIDDETKYGRMLKEALTNPSSFSIEIGGKNEKIR